jgi:hypothetical protein
MLMYVLGDEYELKIGYKALLIEDKGRACEASLRQVWALGLRGS